MRHPLIWSFGTLLVLAAAQLNTGSVTTTENAETASATYASASSTITLSTETISESGVVTSTSGTSSNSTNAGGTVLVGTAVQTSSNGTTTGPPKPTLSNTRPCNGHVEFCQRNYSNITFVGAHNSPFHMQNNAGSNQRYGVVAQLNDGIRMLQGQTHLLNGVVQYCHTTCDLLNAGTAEDYFSLVAAWLNSPRNRFEVVTILIGNGAFADVRNFTDPIEKSGLRRFAYIPEKIPMGINDWPTLGELIALNKRAIIFMDYKADQKVVPYIIDEFLHIWETPLSPQNSSFPCTVERPPKLKPEGVGNRMYMLNNNLNVQASLFGAQVLIPNIAAINTTNAATGQGSLGASTNGCIAVWDRPPNFLLVDFYGAGNFPGSVFQVAAQANGVPYNFGDCCGKSDAINIASRVLQANAQILGFAVFLAAAMAIL